MKRFSMLCILALTVCAVAIANITPTNTSITPAGSNFTWTYDAQLSKDQNANGGTTPTTSPVPHSNTTFASFFTIFDFGGYVPGSCTGPAGWTCTVQNVGFTPDDTIPTDNPNIVNITWTYTGATIQGQPLGKDLGLFTAQSTFSTGAQVSYASRGFQNSGAQAGTVADNIGNTQAPPGAPPPPTPLPPTLILTLSGLALAGLAAFAARKRTGMFAR